jgi:hypothetical protein
MKRINPNPEFVHRHPQAPQGNQVAADQLPLHTLPLEIIEIICQPFSLEETCATLQTHRNIYYPARANDPLWERLFLKHFSFPRVAPLESWLRECETQNRSMYNIIAGRCVISQFNTTDSIVCFARDQKGRFIIGFVNGKTTIFDPKTNEQVVLEPATTNALNFPKKIVCQDDLCAIQYEKKVCVWNLTTQQITSSFECQIEGFDKKIAKIAFVDGRLLVEEAVIIPTFSKNVSGNEVRYTIYIFDLKTNQHPIVLPLLFSPSNTTLHGKTLYCMCAGAPPKMNFLIFWNFESQSDPIKLPYENLLPSESTVFEEGFLLALNEKADFFYNYNLKEIYKSYSYTLWGTPGIPSGFRWNADGSLPYSTKTLSFLFSKGLSTQFVHWDLMRRPGTVPRGSEGVSFKNFLSQRVLTCSPCICDQRKVSILSGDSKGIISLDFTAPKVELLSQIVKMLEAGDKISVDYARQFFHRMPQAVQAAIWSIYDQMSSPAKVVKKPQLVKQQEDHLALIKKATEALGGLEGGQLLIQTLMGAMQSNANVVSLPQEEEMPVVTQNQGTDVGRLKLAIQQYISINSEK